MKLQTYMSMKEIFVLLIDIYRIKGINGFYNMPAWCIYGKREPISPEEECYVDSFPNYDDDDNEILSEFVVENQMYMLYSDELVEDVVMSCVDQKENVSYEEILEALIYYDHNDNFMELV